MTETSSPTPQKDSYQGTRLGRYLHPLYQCYARCLGGIHAARHALHHSLDRPLRWSIRLAIVAGVTSVLTEYGFALTPLTIDFVHFLQQSIVWMFVGIFLLRWSVTPHPWGFLKQHMLQSVLITLVLLDLLTFHTPVGRQWLGFLVDIVDVKRLTVWYVVFIQGFLVLLGLLEGAYFSRRVVVWQIRPAQTLVLSFVLLILVGSGLLMLPNATTGPGSMPFLAALFTATSAVCVTGLIVVDTATYFTTFGQGIILGLCQLGGLGILTFATVIGMMVRGGLGIREKTLLRDFVASRQFGEISVTVRRIVGLTFVIEALGALSLYYYWRPVWLAPAERFWHAVFHAVSAFCNAGFSTLQAGVAEPQTAMLPGVNITLMLLIILGGIGFSVLWESGRWALRLPRRQRRRRQRRLSVQGRLVWTVTAMLILGGAGLFAVLEADGVLAGHSAREWVLTALFQSITARTAGFNTVAIDLLAVPTVVLLVILMLIGASPGSTGGGLKTTTVAVLGLTTLATIRNKARVEAFRRTLPWEVINQAYATFFFAVGVITLGLFILSITETHAFLDLFFEEVSAFATVGLSRGITASLSNTGKCVIIVSMFVGRVGSLTLGVALARQVSSTAYEYPTEVVSIG